MARGWGRSEEDQDAEKEQAREARSGPTRGDAPSSDAVTAGKRRTLELSLAHIEELLAKTTQPARREALESARAEIVERLAGLSAERRPPESH